MPEQEKKTIPQEYGAEHPEWVGRYYNDFGKMPAKYIKELESVIGFGKKKSDLLSKQLANQKIQKEASLTAKDSTKVPITNKYGKPTGDKATFKKGSKALQDFKIKEAVKVPKEETDDKQKLYFKYISVRKPLQTNIDIIREDIDDVGETPLLSQRLAKGEKALKSHDMKYDRAEIIKRIESGESIDAIRFYIKRTYGITLEDYEKLSK